MVTGEEAGKIISLWQKLPESLKSKIINQPCYRPDATHVSRWRQVLTRYHHIRELITMYDLIMNETNIRLLELNRQRSYYQQQYHTIYSICKPEAMTKPRKFDLETKEDETVAIAKQRRQWQRGKCTIKLKETQMPTLAWDMLCEWPIIFALFLST